jgi:hypothetical protein
MWLAECALTPPLPVGWLRSAVSGATGGVLGGEGGTSDYYWHTASGLSQWEHPHVAYLAGVARRLIEARAEEAKWARTVQQQQQQ